MIRCPRCGAQNPDDAAECDSCLGPLSEREDEVTRESEPDETTSLLAVTSDWSGDLLRQATNLLMAGKSREVARLCHEITDREPHNVAAYELLGMAEEENGNLHLAIQAYEQVVALEPGRNLEKEKISALRERLAEQPPEQEEDEETRRIKRLNRWATVVLAASLMLLILAVTAMFAVRARNARLAQEREEQVFAAAMTRGRKLLEQERYDRAVLAFRDADRIKPGNSQARELWREAYQEHRAAVDRDKRSMGGKLSLEIRQNPFQPVWIGPKETSSSATASSGDRPIVPPPPVRVGELPPPLSEGEQDPLGFLGTGTSEPVEDSVPIAPPPELLPPVDEGIPRPATGVINIWVGEPTETVAPRSSADKLRLDADNLRHLGKLDQAKAKYEQAIVQYREEIGKDPSTRTVKEVAIETVQRSIGLCE